MKIFDFMEKVRGVLYIKNEISTMDFKRLEEKLKFVCKFVYAMPNDFAPDVDAKYCFWVDTNRRMWNRISDLPEVLKAEEH